MVNARPSNQPKRPPISSKVQSEEPHRLTASFRDPAGYIISFNNEIYRAVTKRGQDDYERLMSSKLYQELTDKGLLIKHSEVSPPAGLKLAGDDYKLLKPAQVGFISYPYEWSFSALQDAALVTLAAQKIALEHNMIMKDASAYNVQFVDGRAILIDTLSFEAYNGQRSWAAYRQFCQHFLAPLCLMAYVDVRMGLLLREYIDGIPLELAAKLLPGRKKIKAGLALHIVMHSAAQRRHQAVVSPTAQAAQGESTIDSRRSLLGLADSLERAIRKLSLPRRFKTEWGDYYADTNYSPQAFEHKKTVVGQFVAQAKSNTVWDLGGNDGTFSRVALAHGAEQAICFDIDPVAVEKNYRQIRRQEEPKLLSLLADLTNPSPAIGWANQERFNLDERSNGQPTVLALALIHHLAISNNLPFPMIANYFAKLGDHLIVEFIPKTDSKVQILLASRTDIFDQYDQASFEAAFTTRFQILSQTPLKDSQRILYLMKRTS